MGFPVCYSELLLPKLLLDTLSIFTALRRLISALLRLAGLSGFLDPEARDHPASSRAAAPEPPPPSVSAVLMREILPVVRFSDLVDPPESCAVCLYDFDGADEIRRLANCSHVFHRSCLDRWMGYDQMTCPLCRTTLVPDDAVGAINERLWAASFVPEFHGFEEYAHITGL
ncbi:brassinosteroid-responsive RING protein 1 [Rhodamnia argentea]|uniref:Brassinosteroid-responsive RING protein 1 n=1 Tax=Rhodamnia argentea TaxID=178133 RepID=A0A8B8P654_9MYRT|nr:brassinosteroid-responsive RING protein 1 [Rhodamnia argentea]